MLEPRAMAAASGSPAGFMVTGGALGRGALSSSETFSGGVWSSGPQLPLQLRGHCQVQFGHTVIIIGRLLYAGTLRFVTEK